MSEILDSNRSILRQYLGNSQFVIARAVNNDIESLWEWPGEWDIIALRSEALSIGVQSMVLLIRTPLIGRYLFVVPMTPETEQGIVMLKLKLSNDSYILSEPLTVDSLLSKYILGRDWSIVEMVYELS